MPNKIPITVQITINNPSLLAFHITSFGDSPAADHCYFIFDEISASLVSNKIVTSQWTIANILFDSNGAEIITKEGDTIYLSKDIVIVKNNGMQYWPAEISEIGLCDKNS
jgi:hypothetical protein